MMFWSVGPFCYMVYGIWYVVYGMKMAFKVYSHMFRVHRARAAYNIVHLFLVYIKDNRDILVNLFFYMDLFIMSVLVSLYCHNLAKGTFLKKYIGIEIHI